MKFKLILVVALVLTACSGPTADTGTGVASLDESAGSETDTESLAMTDEEAAIAFT